MCHELVKRPLNAQMKEVDDEHLDSRGISNLRVPLDVGKPRPVPDKSGATATVCDVIFHPSLIERALHGRNTAHYQSELGRLAIFWVEKEIGTTVRKEFKVHTTCRAPPQECRTYRNQPVTCRLRCDRLNLKVDPVVLQQIRALQNVYHSVLS